MKYEISEELKDYKIRLESQKGDYTDVDNVKGYPVKIEGYKNYDFFIHEDDMWGFRVSEKSTGTTLTDWRITKDDAAKEACRKLRSHGKKMFIELLRVAAEKYGLVEGR